MHVATQAFLLEFLPAAIAVFFLTRAAAALFRLSARSTARASVLVLVAVSAWFIVSSPAAWVMLGSASSAFVGAMLVERLKARGDHRLAFAAMLTAVAVAVAAFASARWQMDGRSFAVAGVTVLCCHAMAYVIDVYRGEATSGRPLESALYLLQFPVLAGGPIVRSRDFSGHHLRVADGVGLGAFTYGMRRLVIGIVKITLVAGTLGGPVDAIFALPPARLTADAAWLAAACFSLQIYYQFSGYADLAIGLGRMFGLRYPENFRRPYVADSVREFWRRWNITAIMWLRDYLSLPIAGRDAPTPRLFLNIFLGFCLVGLWHGGGVNVLVWAAYSGVWLALEAVGLGTRLERWPRVLRHLYLILVMVVGWVVLRADTNAQALHFLQTMTGVSGPRVLTAWRYLTPGVWTALIVAIVGAGPLVSWISRWRVTLDAATAAIVMMVTALSLFVWRGGTFLADVVRPLRARK